MIELNYDNFSVTLKFLGCIRSKTIHRYSLVDKTFKDIPLFKGSDLQVSPLYEPESPEAIATLLDFLSLGKNDTDEEYFDHYSGNQLEWLTNFEHRRNDLIMFKENIEAIASIFWDIYSLSNEQNIPWDEWKESDDEEQGCFPVRFRLFEDNLYLHTGLADWDTDHRGAIASGYITQSMTEQEILDFCLELYQEVLERA